MQQQILQAELDTGEENLEMVKQQEHDISRGMVKGLIKRKEKLTAKITDFCTAEDVGADRPQKDVILHNIPPTPTQKVFIEKLCC